jgi:hypothetical protein
VLTGVAAAAPPDRPAGASAPAASAQAAKARASGALRIREVGTKTGDRAQVCMFYFDAKGFRAGRTVTWHIHENLPSRGILVKSGNIVVDRSGGGRTDSMSLPNGRYTLTAAVAGAQGTRSRQKTFSVRCAETDTDAAETGAATDGRSAPGAPSEQGRVMPGAGTAPDGRGRSPESAPQGDQPAEPAPEGQAPQDQAAQDQAAQDQAGQQPGTGLGDPPVLERAPEPGPQQLADTGVPTPALVATGAGLVAVGLVLLAGTRRTPARVPVRAPTRHRR